MDEREINRRAMISATGVGIAGALAGGGAAYLTRHAVAGAIDRRLRLITDFPDPARARKPGGVVVHHSATKPWRQSMVTVRAIEKDHKKRGLGIEYEGKVYNLAYHYLILASGKVIVGRPELCPGAHTRSPIYNRWIGVCLVGYFDPQWDLEKYREPTAPQLRALVDIAVRAQANYGFNPENIVPHRRVNATECPGKSFPWKRMAAMYKEAREVKGDIHHSGAAGDGLPT